MRRGRLKRASPRRCGWPPPARTFHLATTRSASPGQALGDAAAREARSRTQSIFAVGIPGLAHTRMPTLHELPAGLTRRAATNRSSLASITGPHLWVTRWRRRNVCVSRARQGALDGEGATTWRAAVQAGPHGWPLVQSEVSMRRVRRDPHLGHQAGRDRIPKPRRPRRIGRASFDSYCARPSLARGVETLETLKTAAC